jgi:hypothetical protein
MIAPQGAPSGTAPVYSPQAVNGAAPSGTAPVTVPQAAPIGVPPLAPKAAPSGTPMTAPQAAPSGVAPATAPQASPSGMAPGTVPQGSPSGIAPQAAPSGMGPSPPPHTNGAAPVLAPFSVVAPMVAAPTSTPIGAPTGGLSITPQPNPVCVPDYPQFICRSDDTIFVPPGITIVLSSRTAPFSKSLHIAGSINMTSSGDFVVASNMEPVVIESGGSFFMDGTLTLDYKNATLPAAGVQRPLFTEAAPDASFSGQFDTVQVEPQICPNKTVASAQYPKPQLSVVFDVTSEGCDDASAIGVGNVPAWGIVLIVIAIIAILVAIAIIVARTKRVRNFFQPYFHRKATSVAVDDEN